VANSITTRVSKHVRTLLCVMLAASLTAPFASQSRSLSDQHHSAHLFDVAAAPATIQANRSGTRLVESARQRPVADAAFLAVQIDGSPLKLVRFALAATEFTVSQFAACKTQSGRSPPQIA
jgi:hypothetical protein